MTVLLDKETKPEIMIPSRHSFSHLVGTKFHVWGCSSSSFFHFSYPNLGEIQFPQIAPFKLAKIRDTPDLVGIVSGDKLFFFNSVLWILNFMKKSTTFLVIWFQPTNFGKRFSWQVATRNHHLENCVLRNCCLVHGDLIGCGGGWPGFLGMTMVLHVLSNHRSTRIVLRIEVSKN